MLAGRAGRQKRLDWKRWRQPRRFSRPGWREGANLRAGGLPCQFGECLDAFGGFHGWGCARI